MEIRELEKTLSDVGCFGDTAEYIRRMYEGGNTKQALQMMRKDRCRLLDEFHEIGRKLDRLDYLIRKTEKEIQTNEMEV